MMLRTSAQLLFGGNIMVSSLVKTTGASVYDPVAHAARVLNHRSPVRFLIEIGKKRNVEKHRRKAQIRGYLKAVERGKVITAPSFALPIVQEAERSSQPAAQEAEPVSASVASQKAPRQFRKVPIGVIRQNADPSMRQGSRQFRNHFVAR